MESRPEFLDRISDFWPGFRLDSWEKIDENHFQMRDTGKQRSNTDHREIDKFNTVSDQWWDPRGAFGALHDINPARVNYIDRRSGLEGNTVLDVGCGGGILAEAMAARGALVTGIDAAGSAIASALEHSRGKKWYLSYRRTTVEEMARAGIKGFDIVVCMELLEHVPNPEFVVQACAQAVKPQGNVFFATLNRNPISYLLAILAGEYILNLMPRGTHDFRKFIKPSELTSWATSAGLSRCDLTALRYNPFTHRCSLGGRPRVNYLMHFRA